MWQEPRIPQGDQIARELNKRRCRSPSLMKGNAEVNQPAAVYGGANLGTARTRKISNLRQVVATRPAGQRTSAKSQRQAVSFHRQACLIMDSPASVPRTNTQHRGCELPRDKKSHHGSSSETASTSHGHAAWRHQTCWLKPTRAIIIAEHGAAFFKPTSPQHRWCLLNSALGNQPLQNCSRKELHTSAGGALPKQKKQTQARRTPWLFGKGLRQTCMNGSRNSTRVFKRCPCAIPEGRHTP